MSTAPKFLGFVPKEDLPVKAGDTITILRGTRVVCHRLKIDRRAGRTYKVVVDHILSGVSDWDPDHDFRVPRQNPRIRWAGTGGYWFEVDINHVPEAVSAT